MTPLFLVYAQTQINSQSMDAKLERGTQNHQTQTPSSEPPDISIQTVDDLARSETKIISSPIGSSCQHSILYQRTDAATSPAKSRASPNTSTSPTGNLFSADVQSTTPVQSPSTLLQEMTDTGEVSFALLKLFFSI